MANKQMHHLKVGDNIFEIVDSVARSGISGAPTIVSLSSAMNDTSKLYLYIGSETGYTSGDWYYHNGTSWVSGGQYGDMQLDTSLTTSGMAADAKSVGDRFNSFASTATAGQAPIADGSGGWYWGAGGKGIPTSVKQAIISLLKKAAISPDLETDPSGETPYDVSGEISVIDEWASTRVVGIRLNPNTISFTEGDSVTISAELIPSDAEDDILWSSSDDSVAIVAEGVVSPVANGTCKIFATVGNVSASCDVTVSGFCTITNNLEYIVNSNTAMGGRVGGTYSGTLTAVKGVLETASVSIIMNGTDVTESVYSNGNIVIQNITGDIVINASIPNTTVQIAKDGYIQYLANTTDGDSAYTQVARTYGAITIPYVRTTPNKYINLAGVIPQNGTVLKYNSKGTAAIFMYDMNDNLVHNGSDVYPQYIDMSQCGFVQNNADTYTEGAKSLTRTLFHKYTFCVDTRYIDDAYLYDVNGGQVYFAGVNTPYYGMTNISQSSA